MTKYNIITKKKIIESIEKRNHSITSAAYTDFNQVSLKNEGY